MEITEKRESIRKNTLRIREKLSFADRTDKSKKITSHVVEWIEDNEGKEKVGPLNAAMVYLNMKSEVETNELIEFLFTQRKQIIVPEVDMKSRMLIPRRIQNLDTDLEEHQYGMQQPKADCPLFPSDQIGIIFVPGIAFDLNGYRLGYGKGYYDRFLPTCLNAITIGIAFQAQIVEDTFPQTWDIPVQHIFTENGMIRQNK